MRVFRCRKHEQGLCGIKGEYVQLKGNPEAERRDSTIGNQRALQVPYRTFYPKSNGKTNLSVI